MPMTGRLLMVNDTLSPRPQAWALSIIFYGVEPAIDPTAAIRPHLIEVRRRPKEGHARASSALNQAIGRFAGCYATGICWPARPVAGVENNKHWALHERCGAQRARALPGRESADPVLRRVRQRPEHHRTWQAHR